jgi:hypothetical protein
LPLLDFLGWLGSLGWVCRKVRGPNVRFSAVFHSICAILYSFWRHGGDGHNFDLPSLCLKEKSRRR